MAMTMWAVPSVCLAIAASSQTQECALPTHGKWGTVQTTVTVFGQKKKLEFHMAVYNTSDIVSDNIVRHGWWQSPVAEALLARIPAGGTLLDVGANIGYFSFVAAAAGLKTISVEAMARNRELIRTTMCRNPSFNVTVVAAALGSPAEEGTYCSMYVRTYAGINNVGNGIMVCGDKQRDMNPKFWKETVVTKTIGSVLRDVGAKRIDSMKMDIEGSECRALDVFPSNFGSDPAFTTAVVEVKNNRTPTYVCFNKFAARYGFGNLKLLGPDMVAWKSPGHADVASARVLHHAGINSDVIRRLVVSARKNDVTIDLLWHHATDMELKELGWPLDAVIRRRRWLRQRSPGDIVQ